MRFARFSIASLVGAVVLSAVGLACLMFASSPWAGATLSVALGALTLALLGASYRRGERRASWAGFALCGWTYMTLSSGPWFVDAIRPQLVTTHLLEWAYPRLIPIARQPNSVATQRTFAAMSAALADGLIYEKLGGSHVDVWAEGGGQVLPSLLAGDVKISHPGSKSGDTITGTCFLVDTGQFARLSQAEQSGRPLIVRPHSTRLLDAIGANPPVSFWEFERVGHALLGLLCGWIGSLAARYFHATRDRGAGATPGGG